MINSDIGYLFQNKTTFINWLSTLNINPTSALSELDTLPKQIRDKNFWEYNPAIFKTNIGKEYVKKKRGYTASFFSNLLLTLPQSYADEL